MSLSASKKPLINPAFSHIYVENEVFDHPRTQVILSRFPRATVVRIDSHRALLNRSRQNWRVQKLSTKLILAKRTEGFIYQAPAVVPTFGSRNSYYNSVVLNCPYDCEYCYLQGMYPSANIVVFVNVEDFFEAALDKLKDGPAYLCISYDTDLLGLEGVLGYVREWIEFTEKTPALTIEVRTKSANFSAISDLAPNERVILAWTISPQLFIDRYEPKTASLNGRLKAIQAAASAGWRVRICVDPVLAEDGWEEQYRGLIEELFSVVPAAQIFDVSIGSFRMNRGYLHTLRSLRPDSRLLSNAQTARYEETIGYSADLSSKIAEQLGNAFSKYLPAQRIDLSQA